MLDAIRKDINQDFISFYTKGFEDGALSEKEILIEKACKWLDINFPIIDNVGSLYKESFIKEFKKHLEK